MGKAFDKNRAEMKKKSDSLAALEALTTAEDENDVKETVVEKTAEETPKAKKSKTAEKPEKKPEKAAEKKEPVAEEKPATKQEPEKEEKKTSKMVDMKNIPGGVYIPPLTSRSRNDKLSSVTQFRMTAETDANIRTLAGELQRSYNYVINMILEAYFDALNESK